MFDTSLVNEDQAAEVFVLPPTIQWYRGWGTGEHQVIQNGGFELPTKNKLIEGVEVIKTPHGQTGEVKIDAHLFPWLHISMVAYKKDYYEWYEENGTDKKRFFSSWAQGRYSRVRAWCFVKELKKEEYILTFSSNDAGRFEQACKEFYQRVILPSNNDANTRFPFHFFWMPLKAGAKEQVRKSYITPPTLALPESVTLEKRQQLYVVQGDTKIVAEKGNMIYSQVKEWAEHKREEGKEQPPSQIPEEPPAIVSDNSQPEPPPAFVEDEIPF